MEKYNLIPQEKPNFCVCSALQAIFRRKGLEITQEQIALNLTHSPKGFLIDDNKIKELMSANGFEYENYYHNTTPFNEPDGLLYEMNLYDGIIGINSHVFLLNNFSDPQVEIINPKDGEISVIDFYKMLRDMSSKIGVFGLIKHIQ
ncbi:hypothetical protein K8R47_02085 [archaeon]|nr:hypothetical protein [archaeon]